MQDTKKARRILVRYENQQIVEFIVSVKKELFSTSFSFQGDSGGPLMWQHEDGRWLMMGTVSHGIKCAYPNLPGVYMRMTYYKPWIEKVTGEKF